MRDILTDLEDAFTNGNAQLAMLGEFDFDAQTIYLWNGTGTITYNGNDYIGAGNLISVSPYQETQDLESQGLKFTLSGISSDILALALAEEYQGNPCRLYLAQIDTDNTVIEAYRLFTGIMDTIDISDNAETSKMTLSAENIMNLLNSTKVSRYSDEDQKSKYPLDEGFSLIAQNQDKVVSW